MQMTGEQFIPLLQQKVWAALNDPAVLKQCIAGCDSFERVSDHEFKMGMTAVVGPVKARFTGKLVLSDVVPPSSYSIAFDGSGGVAGFGKGGAKVKLVPVGPGTKLEYQATAQVGGKLAQVGSRLIDGVAKKMADDFFTKFVAAVAPAPAAVPGAEGGVEAAPVGFEAPAAQFNPMWFVAAVIIVQLLLYLLLAGR